MAAASTNRNWFAIWVSIAVVVVLVGLGGLVVFLNNQATAPGVAPKSDIVDEKTGAISFGEGKDEVDTYVDFMCPACNAFEGKYGDQLQAAAAADEITLKVHPVAILDHLSQNTKYSTRAGGSAYCVAENAPKAFFDYFNMLFERQPAELSTGLTDDELASIAEETGAGAAVECIKDGTYQDFVSDHTKDIPAHPETGQVSTPTIAINGERLDLPAGDETKLQKLLG